MLAVVQRRQRQQGSVGCADRGRGTAVHGRRAHGGELRGLQRSQQRLLYCCVQFGVAMLRLLRHKNASPHRLTTWGPHTHAPHLHPHPDPTYPRPRPSTSAFRPHSPQSHCHVLPSMPPSPAAPQIWCEDGLPPTRAQAPGFFSELKEVRYDMMVNSSLNHRFSPLEGARQLLREWRDELTRRCENGFCVKAKFHCRTRDSEATGGGGVWGWVARVQAAGVPASEAWLPHLGSLQLISCAGLRTEAVLSLDDDIIAPCSVLDELFEVSHPAHDAGGGAHGPKVLHRSRALTLGPGA